MKKSIILTLIIIGFIIILFFCFGKKQEKTDTVTSTIERNEVSSLPTQYDVLSHKNLFEPEKVLEESKPVEEEKKVLFLEKPETSVVDDVRGEEDSNGVRHDVNLWIAEQPITYDQKLALIQRARSMQIDLVNADRISKLDIKTAREEAKILTVNTIKAMKCILEKFKDETIPFAYTDSLEKLILNTKKRIEADEQLNEALTGAAIVSPEGDPCEN